MDKLSNYRGLLTDTIRIEAFQKAIQSLISKDSTVAEIGSALGTYSFFAAKSGAAKIYAIEMDDIYHVGQELSVRNNLSEKIVFINKKSTDTTLPENVDFIIMEDYSPIFNYEHLQNTLKDARDRFLKPGGRFIPNDFSIKFVPVQADTLYKNINPWQESDDKLFDIDWSYTSELILNRPHYVNQYSIIPLTDEQTLMEFSLNKEYELTFSFSKTLKANKSGTIHGLGGWWDCLFAPDHPFTNSPLKEATSWGQMFFPLEKPVQVKKDEEFKVDFQSLRGKYSGSIEYQWGIETESIITEQNTFMARYLPPEIMKNLEVPEKPELNETGRIIQFTMKLINQNISREQIISQCFDNFNSHFKSHEEVVNFLSTNLKNFLI